MVTGLLALQGAFLDHIPHLKKEGAEIVIVNSSESINSIDRLIIPGGESIVMGKFLGKYRMREKLVNRTKNGMPVWGICAGAILLADEVRHDKSIKRGPLKCLDISVIRNAYGRQIKSSIGLINVENLGKRGFPAIFIRAPRIEIKSSKVKVLAEYNGDPVFVRQGNIIATTFHPELTADNSFHKYFLSI